MKTHALKKLLETGYFVTKEVDYHTKIEKLCIGGPYCHDLISLFTDNLKFKFAMDTFNEGESYILNKSNEKLSKIYLKLKSMVESGEIREYLEGDDSGKISVYYEEDGEIIETFCTEPGYPNTTNDGTFMYQNTHFSDPISCAKYAYDKEDHREWVLNDMRSRVQQKKDELKKAEEYLEKRIQRYERLRIFLEETP